MNMRSLIVQSLVAIGFTIFVTPAVSAASVPKEVNTTIVGMDISYPQCSDKLPSSYAFGIVGVNGGLATTGNPCLSQQLQWAYKATGNTKQDKVQLYVNTANPGGLNTPSWPQDNVDASGYSAITPYGLCTGDDDLACAWQYGWNRAQEDVDVWFKTAATQARVNPDPTMYTWWLDVELENTWKLGKTDFDYKSNIAVLEGMEGYFFARGITKTGLYSTAYQWGVVTGGKLNAASTLAGKPNWRPGGRSISTAKQACSATPLTVGGSVVLAQYISRGLDYNVSCIE